MQNLSGVKLFVMAGVAGLIAVTAGYYYLDLREQQLRNAYAPQSTITVALVVPQMDLAKGDVLTKDKLAIKQVPIDYIPSQAVTAENWKLAVGRTLVAPLQIGKPISWSSIAGDSVDRFSENIEIGKRAKTITISKVNSIDGLLRPGDRIDLYGMFSSNDIGIPAEENFSDEVLLLVLEHTEVLAAGREDAAGKKYERFVDKSSADGFNMSFTTVTLHVSEYQAAKIELAQEAGELMAVLRNPDDTALNNTPQLRISDLLKPDPVEAVDLVLDENGKTIGRIVGNKVVDENGRVIGEVIDGKVVDLKGELLGTVVAGTMDSRGKIASVAGQPDVILVSEDVVRDTNGNIIGKIVDGQVIDAQGNVIGSVKDSVALALDGNVLGEVSTRQVEQLVVRDSSGKIIGKIVDGRAIDDAGNVIGKIVDGRVIDNAGNAIEVSTASASAKNTGSRFIQFIAGGKGEDGVNAVQRILVK